MIFIKAELIYIFVGVFTLLYIKVSKISEKKEKIILFVLFIYLYNIYIIYKLFLNIVWIPAKQTILTYTFLLNYYIVIFSAFATLKYIIQLTYFMIIKFGFLIYHLFSNILVHTYPLLLFLKK